MSEALVEPNATSRRQWAPFAVVGAVLLAAALGLQVAVASLELHFKKQPVPLAAPLTEAVPRELGPWRFVGFDEPMSHAIEEAMGTELYLQRPYVDTRHLSADEIAGLDRLDKQAARVLVARLRERVPTAVVTLHMAYYTGGVDTVPHIPDRCMVAGGFEPDEASTIAFELPVGGEPEQVRLRSVSFVDASTDGRDRARFNVAYFFQVNGAYAHDPITGVRQELAKLTSKHGYFCKIELMCVTPDRAAGEAAMGEFLTHAMPDIEAALPDWHAVQSGSWGGGGADEADDLAAAD